MGGKKKQTKTGTADKTSQKQSDPKPTGKPSVPTK